MATKKGASLAGMMKKEAAMDKKSGDKNRGAAEKKLEKQITKRGGKA